jgi:hypothetical protein
VAALAPAAPTKVKALAASNTFSVDMDKPSLLFSVFYPKRGLHPLPFNPQAVKDHGSRQGSSAPHGRTMSHSPRKGNILKSGVVKN